MSTTREHERALVGAALLEPRIAGLLLSELGEDDFQDPTCRAVVWALRCRESEPEDDLAELWDAAYGEGCVVLESEATAEVLERAGLNMASDVASLVEDRPELREAIRAGLAALSSMCPVEEEPVVELARVILG